MEWNTSVIATQILQIAQDSPHGLLLFDSQLQVVFSNRTAESLLNHESGSINGKSLVQVLPSECFNNLDPSVPQTTTVKVGEQTLAISYQPKRTDESTFGSTQPEGLLGFVSIVDMSDIVRLREENEELREAARDLDAIFEFSSDEIYVTDGTGVTLRVNHACEKFYGIPASALIGRNVRDLEAEGIFSPSISRLVLESKEPVTLVQDTRSGRKIIATANPVFDTDGKIIRVVTNSRDITEFDRLRNRLTETESLVERYLSEVEALRQENARMDNVIVRSQALRRVVQMVKKIAPFDSIVLLQGESGTGKDTIAKMIHGYSPRSSGPFIKVNCGAIPETLIESELFGYVPGAFTGAQRGGKVGVVELANKGTLFLNEIDTLPLQLQVKMLHLIQERKFMKVGGTKVVEVDFRIVAASNKDLGALVERKRFREDLFYRLNVIEVRIPPLREREDDIAPLVAHFLKKVCARYGIDRIMSAQAMDLMVAYSWPGNVRELENAVERAAVVSNNSIIQPEDLPENIRVNSPRYSPEASSASLSLSEGSAITPARYAEMRNALEREMLVNALRTHRTTRKVAASLGISQSTVVRRMKRHGIRPSTG